MAGKKQHVLKASNGGWAVRGENNKRDTSTHRTQKEATEAARRIARRDQGEVIIHGKDGRIVSKSHAGAAHKENPSLKELLFNGPGLEGVDLERKWSVD